MDILVINCNTSSDMTESIRVAASAAAHVGTNVVAVNPEWGVTSAEGFYDSFVSAAAVLDLLADWTRPMDAVVMAGFGEHGREGARQLVDVPVVDITEAAAMTACLVSHTYAVVTSMPAGVRQIEQSLMNAGLQQRCVGVRATDMPVLNLHDDLGHTVDAFAETGAELVAAGAEAIVLGCAGLAGLQERVAARLGVPVIDGVSAAITLCEALVQQGLRTSKIGAYATPDLTKQRPGWPVNRHRKTV